MALFEFYCEACRINFEQITSSEDVDHGKCPKCNGKNTKKLISRFAIGGQGDLRESTLHGCHEAHVAPDGADGHHHSDHDHGHGGQNDHS